MVDKPTIIAAGTYRPGTGFTRVLEAIFSRLADHFEIHFVGLAYSGPIISDSSGRYTVYPTDVRIDTFGAWRCAELAMQKSAELVFLCNDFWMLPNYRNALTDYQNTGGKVVGYCPLDGKIVDDSILADVDFLDQLVLYHASALKQVQAAIDSRREKHPDFNFPRLNCVPHGVDCDVFYPLREIDDDANRFNFDRGDLKAKLFPTIDFPQDAFVVLNANRYHARKRIDLTIQGFGEFAEGKDNVWLYLHHAILDEEHANEIEELAEAALCRDRVLFNQTSSGQRCLSNDGLNQLYNACDVGINTAMGEGWGLIAFEHAATGAAQIMPRVPNQPLWRDNALYLETVRKYVPKWSPFEMVEVDPRDLAACLDSLFNQTQLLSQQSERAFRHARNADFEWSTIARTWAAIFEGAMNS